MNVIKIIVLIVFALLVVIIAIQYYRCYTRAKEEKKPYECDFFKSAPKFIQPEEIHYRVKEGKCLEITDYGRKMGRREVDMVYCNQY